MTSGNCEYEQNNRYEQDNSMDNGLFSPSFSALGY